MCFSTSGESAQALLKFSPPLLEERKNIYNEADKYKYMYIHLIDMFVLGEDDTLKVFFVLESTGKVKFDSIFIPFLFLFSVFIF